MIHYQGGFRDSRTYWSRLDILPDSGSRDGESEQEEQEQQEQQQRGVQQVRAQVAGLAPTHMPLPQC